MEFKFWNELDSKMKRVFTEMAVLLSTLLVLIVLICLVIGGGSEAKVPEETLPPVESTGETTVATEPKDTSPEGIMATYMAEHGLTSADYTADMMEVYKYFPEVREFILAIPLEAGRAPVNDISNESRENGVPLFLQFDERWGYTKYGSSVCGLAGCGPTTLSMVAYYLTGNTAYTPVYMMELAKEKGYLNSSGGTNWTMFQQGPGELGLESKEVPLYEPSIINYLKKGIPVVVNVGPGDFTLHGHYMVIVGYENEKFRINDPFSVENSNKLWSYSQIESQIKNLWAVYLPEDTAQGG